MLHNTKYSKECTISYWFLDFNWAYKCTILSFKY